MHGNGGNVDANMDEVFGDEELERVLASIDDGADRNRVGERQERSAGGCKREKVGFLVTMFMRNSICGSGPTNSQAVTKNSTSVATPPWSTLLGSSRVLLTL